MASHSRTSLGKGLSSLMNSRVTNIILLCTSVVVSFLVLEFASRMIFPISPGARYLSLDGKNLPTISEGKYRLKSNLEFRQVSHEFDVRANTNSFGNRITDHIKQSGSPNIIFLGDSFTFGHGLEDEQTFAYQFCRAVEQTCANLGRSGTGTLVQINVLEHYLKTEQWRPSEVKLFLFAMTATLMSGNDLLDNYYYAKTAEAGNPTDDEKLAEIASNNVRAPFKINFWLELRIFFLAHSNLARIAYSQVAPMLRHTLSPTPSEDTLKVALAATSGAFRRLHKLSLDYNFDYSIYLLHPIQDILRGTDGKTLEAIQKISGGASVIDTADLFRSNPSRFYFSYDGHLNSEGARNVANFLMSGG